MVQAREFVASQTMQDLMKLWHIRMGHISEKGLVELKKQNLLRGDKMKGMEFCDH